MQDEPENGKRLEKALKARAKCSKKSELDEPTFVELEVNKTEELVEDNLDKL